MANALANPDYFAIDNDPRPILVWIHGGGWIAGDKAAEVPQLIPYLERGWNVVNGKLSTRPGHRTTGCG